MTELISKWGRDLDKEHVLKEYPRSKLVRDSYINLNGEWDYAISKSDVIGEYDGKILVPFSPETELSGVKRIVEADDFLHYHLAFDLPRSFVQNRVLLHFGAVDQECEVYLNDQKIGEHQGGYLPFSIDVTSSIEHEKENHLKLIVTDKTEYSPHARGKQKRHKKDKMDSIFYTPSSGIWKTVWLESVPKSYIKNVKIQSNYDESSVMFHLQTNNQPGKAVVEISFENERVLDVEIETDKEVTIPLEGFHAWSPEEPNLYDVAVRFQKDEVSTYFGMRKLTKDRDINGTLRFFLNNEPYYINGLLDQGYWPESLLTAPSDEALKFDIVKTKELGFNTIRKHVKIEPERFYAHCDRIGMLVLQDMPNGGDDIKKPFVMYFPNVSDRLSRKIDDSRYKWFGRANEAGREMYYNDLEQMIEMLYNYPSIGMWVPFNEGWGQFDANEATRRIEELDTTRLIMETSGWFDQGGGDVFSIHNYFKKLKIKPDEKRVVAVTEFGGFAFPVKGHLFDAKAFGYRSYKSPESLAENYRALFEKQILPQLASGLSGSIYTQTTDVEGEVNGLMTYDRKVEKIDPRVIQSINKAIYHVFDRITK